MVLEEIGVVNFVRYLQMWIISVVEEKKEAWFTFVNQIGYNFPDSNLETWNPKKTQLLIS